MRLESGILLRDSLIYTVMYSSSQENGHNLTNYDED